METLNIWTLLAILKRRLWVVLLLFAATMIFILGRNWLQPTRYESSLTLQLLPLEPEEVTLYTRLDTASTAAIIDQIFYQFDYLVRSPRVAGQTLAETGLSLPLHDLVKGITVKRDPWIAEVTVSLTADSPEAAETLVARQVALALAELRQSRSQTAETSGRFLETALATAKQELDTAQEALLRFKLANRVEYLDREIIAAQDALRSLGGERQGATLEAQRLDAIAGALEAQIKDAQAAAKTAEDAQAGYYAQLAEDLHTARLARQAEAAGQRAIATKTTALLADHQTTLTSLITLAGEYQQLVDTAKEKANTRDFLAAKAREARLKFNQSRDVGYLEIISSPSTPQIATSAPTLKVALLAGGLSLIAGILLAFVLEFIEQTLRHAPRPQHDQK